MNMEIKICGLTKVEEAAYLNENNVNYAGFVFFEKSKRNVTLEKAKKIAGHLSKDIKKVAVLVSPDAALIEKLQEADVFDVLQVHKELTVEVLEAARIPVWYAFNIADPAQIEEKQHFLQELPGELSKKIEALVVDGAEYGSGKTFDWSKQIAQTEELFLNRRFVLAGGLHADNVKQGINIFHPDVVDVSSGVEGETGKDEEKVRAFVLAARAKV